MTARRMRPFAFALPRAGLLIGLALAPSHTTRRDLDVDVPPGSPTDWTQAFPASRPPPEPLFRVPVADPERTLAISEYESESARLTSSFALVRVLTWDIAAHLSWLGASRDDEPPTSGRPGLRPRPTRYGDPLYWVSMAPLLRLMLHRGQVPRAQTIAHLVELGDPTLAALSEAERDPSLRVPARDVRERVLGGDEDNPVFEPEDPRQAMLARFTAGELLSLEPYDPTAPFAARLLLFADEVFPILAAFAQEEHATTLRRNAVAALTRYPTRAAAAELMEIAAETEDQVALMRALAGIGRFKAQVDWTPLAERLASSSDSVERVAIAEALGRARAPEALPAVLAVAKRAYSNRDSDELIAALLALARIPAGERADDVDDLLRAVSSSARGNPRGFQPDGKAPSIKADRPDGPRTRGNLILQLCIAARFLADPADEDRLEDLFDIFAGEELGRADADYAVLLDSIQPPARFLVVEALGATDDPRALYLLRSFAADRDETQVGGRALAVLPLAHRVEIALDRFDDDPVVVTPRGTPLSESRMLGLERLLADAHADSSAFCRRVLKELAALPPGSGSPAQRMLGRLAIEGLAASGVLRTTDLLPLLPHVRAAEDAFGELPEEVVELVEELIQIAGIGAQKVELGRRVDDILGLVVEGKLNPDIDEETRERRRALVLETLEDVRAHRQDPPYLRSVRSQILVLLLGYDIPLPNPDLAEFSPPSEFERAILLGLGRTRSSEAGEVLLTVLANPRNRHRADACLALGMTGRSELADELARYLLDPDGFVRFAAYESLRHLARGPADAEFVDWMYADSAVRNRAAEAWYRALVERDGR